MTTLTAALTKSDPLGKFPLLFLQTGLFFAAVNFPSLHRVNVPPCWRPSLSGGEGISQQNHQENV